VPPDAPGEPRSLPQRTVAIAIDRLTNSAKQPRPKMDCIAEEVRARAGVGSQEIADAPMPFGRVAAATGRH
jgi:hypothetical protein